MVLEFSQRSGVTRHLLGVRGTILLEVMVSSLVLVVVIMAIGSLFVGNMEVFSRGREQMELQRIGTLIVEGVTRAIREASRVEGYETGGRVQEILVFYPGEPFFDANYNGVFDTGEDFIDIYQSDSDGSETGFRDVWNCASDGTGTNPMPTAYFKLEGGKIKKGTEQADSVDWDILVSGATAGAVWVDDLEFDTSGDQLVGITFRIRDDLGTVDPSDDIDMAFSSSVSLRE